MTHLMKTMKDMLAYEQKPIHSIQSMILKKFLVNKEKNLFIQSIIGGQRWGFNEINHRAASVPMDTSPCFQSGWCSKKKSLMDVFVKMTPYIFQRGNFIFEKTSHLTVETKMQLLVGGGRHILAIYWHLVYEVIIKIWWEDKFMPLQLHFLHVKKVIQGNYMRIALHQCQPSSVSISLLGCDTNNWWVEWSHLWSVCSILGVMPWWKHVNLALNVYMPLLGFCPGKPHIFSNEYHLMYYGVSGVVLDVELVGKESLAELNKPKRHVAFCCGCFANIFWLKGMLSWTWAFAWWKWLWSQKQRESLQVHW